MRNGVMDLLKRIFILLAFSYFSFAGTLSYAVPELPFNVAPKAGTTLPTTLMPNSTAPAFYTVRNNTLEQRNENFVKYLPPNVSQVTTDPNVPDICGETFNLSPRQTAGDSCTLELSVFGPVNAADPDPHNHLFVCFPEGLTCAGTKSPLNVNQISLVSVLVTPLAATINVGQTLQYTAVATFSDGTTLNVTGSALWASANNNVATISGSGLATGISQGTTNITATYLGLISNPAVLTVANPVITVTPDGATLAVNHTLQYHATATFANGTSIDVTNLSTWTSTNTNVATINPATGVATGVSEGPTQIIATFQGVASTPVNLTVNNPVETIDIIPLSAGVHTGKTVQFTATAIFADTTQQNVTGTATWASSSPQIATIVAGGVATGVSGGTTTITATFQGVTSNPGATLTVFVLDGITVTPSNPTIQLGTSIPFMASGHYTDNNSDDITTSSTWTSDNTAVATMSGNVATGVGTGPGNAATAGIRASKDGITSAPATLTVVNNLDTLVISTTPTPPNIGTGQTQQYTATGNFFSGPPQDLTKQVDWTSATTAVATIQDGMTNGGLLTGVSVGTSNISATITINGNTKTSNTISQQVHSYLYIVNTATPFNILICTLEATGQIIAQNCQSNTLAPKPLTVTLNPTLQLAYVTDATDGKVTVCTIDTASGNFTSCGDSGVTFTAPIDVVIHPNNTVAYILDDTQVIKCNIKTDGTFDVSSCGATGIPFNTPQSMAINRAGTYVLISDLLNKSVTTCQIAPTTNSLISCNPVINVVTGTPGGITINAAADRFYIVDSTNNFIRNCGLNASGGIVNPCFDKTDGVALPSPRRIVINGTSNFLYVTNNTNVLGICPVSGITIGVCTANTPPAIPLSGPYGIAIQRLMTL